MREYPVNWIPGIVLWCGALIGVPLLVAAFFGLRAMRSARWRRERAGRQLLERARASVESCERVTSVGDFQLVLSFELKADAYRVAVERARFRGLARLSAAIVEQAKAGEVVIRFDPANPTRIFVELDDPELERRAFLERGIPQWKRVEHFAPPGS